MAFDTFDIYFRGEMLPDHDPATVRAQLGELFKLDGRGVDKLFAGTPVRVKQAVDVERAGKYRERFRRAGALVQIVPHGQPCPAAPATGDAAAPATAAAERALGLLPPGSGSLADCAPPPATFASPDLSGLDLAAPGTPLDEQRPPAPLEIDIASLTMSAAGTGSLEDCQADVAAAPLPDISGLDLAQAGITLDETTPPPPLDIDTGKLSAAPPNSGSLADCVVDKPAVEIPDISDLELLDD